MRNAGGAVCLQQTMALRCFVEFEVWERKPMKNKNGAGRSMNRRAALAGLLSTSALPAWAQAIPSNPDVAIVGAGAAGLAAAPSSAAIPPPTPWPRPWAESRPSIDHDQTALGVAEAHPAPLGHFEWFR